ncbi:MAG: DUF3501 family protein [Alphaproteobacteria bacterium]|nr:DUF3501 family protein [Alphaproteobacteria bacterium]
MTPRVLTPADILPIPAYEAVRADRRRALIEAKRHRRLAVGPYMTVLFESYDSMWMQVHEMLRVEKGGDAQIPGELEAYNSLIPQGAELVATALIEIDDERLRRAVLADLGGIEHSMSIAVAGERVAGIPEADLERTDETGKASSVHFIHFPFTPAQVAAFRDRASRPVFVIDHPHYGHMAMIDATMQASLAADFD